MRLDALAGNAALKQQLSAQEKGRGLSHAYLISGPAGSGKRTLARLLCAAMVCTGEGERPCGACPACKKVLSGIHPDVIQVGADGKDISVGQAREARSDAYIRPNEGARKVYVFHNAQDMTAAAQNALLKLLEEGPAYAAFLLLAENPGSVLTTIRSRCEGAALAPVTAAEAEYELARRFPQLPREQRHAAAKRCGGLLGRAVAELEGQETGEQLQVEAARFLDLITLKNELEFAAWCVCLEKWERGDLVLLLEHLQALLRDALALQRGLSPTAASPGELPALQGAAALPPQKLLALAELIRKLRNDAAFHVNTGQLCGALAAGVYGGNL